MSFLGCELAVGWFSHLAKAIEHATWSSSDESSGRINHVEYTLRRCIMPPHRCPNYGNEKLPKKHPGGTKGASVLHNSRQDANKR